MSRLSVCQACLREGRAQFQSVSHSLTLLKLLLSSWSIVTKQRSFSPWVTSHWHESRTYPAAGPGCSPRALPGWVPQSRWVWSSQRSWLSALWTPLLPGRAGRAPVPFLHAILQELPSKLPSHALMALSCPVFPPCWCHFWLLVLLKVLFHRCRGLATIATGPTWVLSSKVG